MKMIVSQILRLNSSDLRSIFTFHFPQGKPLKNRKACSTAKFLTAMILMLLTTAPALANEDNSLIIQNVRIFDGRTIHNGKQVVIRDGVIAALIDQDEDTGAGTLIDGQGGTLIPGLIDAHAHSKEAMHLNEALRFGVTTVMDMATPAATLADLKQAASERNDVAGYFSSGFLATPPGGHGTQYGGEVPTVASPTEAAAFLASRSNEGSDYLKLVLSGMRAKSGTPTLDADTVLALVKEAHARDMVTVAHIETAEDARTAAEAGVDGLAHIWRDQGSKPEISQLLADKGVFVITTLSVFDGFVDSAGGSALMADPRLKPWMSEFTTRELTTRTFGPEYENINRFIEAVSGLVTADVTLLTGTDSRNGTTSYGATIHRELELLVEAGLTPEQALSAATSNIAEAFGLDDRGVIEVGRRADLVLLRGNPTDDVTESRDILRVWRGGYEFDRSLESGSQ